MALDYCEDVGYLDRNPMRHMTAPRTGDSETRVMTVDQVRTLLGAVHGSRWEAAYWILATTGMRVSEMLGLEWRNIDLDTGRIQIEHQTARVYGEPGVRLVPLKTKSSHREVIAPPSARTALRWHEDRQRLERRRAEDLNGWEEYGTVFSTPSGKLYYRSQFEDDFRTVTGELGISGATPHTLRHTAATLLQESGTTLKTAQALLGHATERMTLQIYSHRTSSSLGAVADTMQHLFGDVQDNERAHGLTTGDTTAHTTSGYQAGYQTGIETA